MIRLSANLSKKVPLPGVEYSSQQYGAAMEIEVGDGDKPEAIQQRIRELYGMLANAIDEQISGVPGSPAPQSRNNGNHPPSSPASRPHAETPTNGNGRTGKATSNGRHVTATEAQCRAIFAICKSQGIDVNAVLADYNVSRAEDLNVRDASRLIDELKSKQNTPPARH